MEPRAKSPKKDKFAPPVEKDPEAEAAARAAFQSISKKKRSLYDRYGYHMAGGIFLLAVAIVAIFSLFGGTANIYTTDVNDSDYISKKNAAGLTFTVGPVELFKGYKLRDAKFLINNQASNKNSLYYCSSSSKETIVPERYNFREAYPECSTPIYSQGNCSSSYAITVTSVITNRWCRSNPTDFPRLSPQSLISCKDKINNECQGGFLSRALDIAKIYGLVDDFCYPFSEDLDSDEKCLKKIEKCQKYKTGDYCVASNEANVKQEIFNYGPVITVIPVFRDFLVYKDGMYQVYPNNEKYTAGHAVKIIGWDIIEGQGCWLVENSWGEDWGQNGIGCIKFNDDELKIEGFTLAVALNTEEKEEEIAPEEAPITEEL